MLWLHGGSATEGTWWHSPVTAQVLHELGVVVGESVTFRFFGSSTRRDDVVGTLLEAPERELTELAPIAITLPAQGRDAGDLVAVTLEAVVTEVGTLELFARPIEPRVADEHWKVELSVRSDMAAP